MSDYTKVIINALKQWVNRQLTVLDKKINNKVDSVEGKALSTNDYTNEEKRKLANIEAGATRTVVNGRTGDVVIEFPSTEGLATEEYVDSAITNINTYYTKTEIDNMEFITLDEIDAICAHTIEVVTPTTGTF